jgi:hypothetical protein
MAPLAGIRGCRRGFPPTSRGMYAGWVRCLNRKLAGCLRDKFVCRVLQPTQGSVSTTRNVLPVAVNRYSPFRCRRVKSLRTEVSGE